MIMTLVFPRDELNKVEKLDASMLNDLIGFSDVTNNLYILISNKY